MKIIVLGAAAGGGFPQWNSRAEPCRRARRNDPVARARTQAGVAVSQDGERWFLLNASPDLRTQIERTPALHPREGLRSTPIAGVVLAGGDVDAIAGLLTLRERQPFALLATREIHGVLDANPIFDVLARDVVERRVVPLDTEVVIDSNMTVELFAVPGKVPLYLEQRDADALPVAADGVTVGVMLRSRSATMLYVPGCAAMTPALARRIDGTDLVLFDGTLWRDDEMIVAGIGTKTGRRMGHMSVAGPDGTFEAFRSRDVRRKVLIHINNSNPILLDDSLERAALDAAGWEVAYDGMEMTL
ncbi:pyrroloquinoline quinone biosynthesis protein PqqB [Burkholderia anthina]|uniref:pyrroloquinoline quinone biosynthesis protein PqqB n=1 Tax=Burkholderia anthina TaxID=179879 RepID=UPI00158CFA9F|nr:pyrroloquinoline quinone biosynthesis protein PqqB [Burkholderia anthina]